MKYTYICHGKWKTPATLEEIRKAMDKVMKEAEKHGLKVLAWGAPYGVSENCVVVYGSEKGVDNYFSFGQAVELPYTDARTTIAIQP